MIKITPYAFFLMLSGLFSGVLLADTSCPKLLNHEVRMLAGDDSYRLCDRFSGKVLMVVNTASQCAFTDQYAELEALYERYKNQDLVVIGIPSNDFAGQEPGNENEIKDFCRLTYGVKFPMLAKSHVRGDNADPLYHDLALASGTYPRWNFHKYLIGRDGQLINQWGSRIVPDDPKIIAAIEESLVQH